MSAVVDTGRLLEVTPGYRSGRPYIAGTGITVHVIAAHHDQGYDADELHEALPHASMAGIHATLAYYYSHKQQITDEIDQDNHEAHEFATTFPGAELISRSTGNGQRATDNLLPHSPAAESCCIRQRNNATFLASE